MTLSKEDSEHWVFHGDTLEQLKRLKARLKPEKGKYSNQDAMKDILAMIADPREQVILTCDNLNQDLSLTDGYQKSTGVWVQDLKVIIMLWFEGKITDLEIHDKLKELLEGIQ